MVLEFKCCIGTYKSDPYIITSPEEQERLNRRVSMPNYRPQSSDNSKGIPSQLLPNDDGKMLIQSDVVSK